MGETALREAICEVGRRLWTKGFTAATDGNISVRLSSGTFLSTPSGISKGFMKPEDLVLVDADGDKIAGTGNVTSEFRTHLAAYEERPDIGAVVHAHPPKAVAASLVGVSLAEPLLPEVVLAIGGIPTVPYATPASAEGGKAIRGIIRRCDAVIIAKHGTLTVGRDVFAAYLTLEKVEHAAETVLWAKLMGTPEQLSASEIEALHRIQRTYFPEARLFQPE